MATNSITLDVILKDIDKTAEELKDTYVKNLKKVSESAFKKTATRVINDMLETKHTDMWKYGDDDRTKAQIEQVNNRINSAIAAAYKKYVEEYNKAKLIKTQAEEAAKKAAAITVDFDPYVENGGSVKAKSYIDVAVPDTIDKKTGKNVIQKKSQLSIYHATNNSYSGCDIVCTVDFPTNTGKSVSTTFGTLQTISYSIHQEKTPVRVLGNMNAKDWVFGPRTIAGSLVFAVLNKHWLVDIYDQLYDNAEMKGWHFIADEIPPFNITISFANEYGFDSRMAIYGVRLLNEGQTMSINDLYIENTYQFVASDINYMDSLGNYQRGESKIAKSQGVITVETATSKVREKKMVEASKGANSGISNEEMTLEKAMKLLEFTEDTWNKLFQENNKSPKLTKEAALKNLESAYKKILADKNFISDKGNKNTVKHYYETALKMVDELYAKAKEANGAKEEEAAADHPYIVKSILEFDDLKWTGYKNTSSSIQEAYNSYKKELDAGLERAKQRLDTGLFTENDYAYAKALYAESVKKLNEKMPKEEEAAADA